MRSGIIPLLACSFALGLCGCSSQEEQPKVKTASDIQAEIETVQSNPNIPENSKATIIENLKSAKAKAEKRETAH